MAGRTYTLQELGELSELPVRTIRYYIQAGLVPRPEGARKTPEYSDRHLEAILAVKRLAAEGLTLTRIAEKLHSTVVDGQAFSAEAERQPGSVGLYRHVAIVPGVELVIDAERAALSPEALREIILKVLEIAEADDQPRN